MVPPNWKAYKYTHQYAKEPYIQYIHTLKPIVKPSFMIISVSPSIQPFFIPCSMPFSV